MMRWEPTNTDGVGEDRGIGRAGATIRAGDVSTARYLLDAVVATVAGLGARSIVIMVVMALIVATLLFGFSAGETEAMMRWCRGCTGPQFS